MKKDFYDQPLFTISNYFIAYFLNSIYFSLCNILLIFFFLLIEISSDNFSLFSLFVALIPLGPALGSLYCTMGKVVREKELFSSSYYWKSYKNNFISFLKIWMFFLSVIYILLFDFMYFYLNSPQTQLYWIFMILTVLFALLGTYAFSINSRFKITFKNLIILSISCMFKNFGTSILKFVIMGIIYYLCKNLSIGFLLFIHGIICMLFYYYDKAILDKIEKTYISSSSY